MLLNYFSTYIKQRRSELKNEDIYYVPRLKREDIVRFDAYQTTFLRNYYGGHYNTCLNVLQALKYGGLRRHTHLVTPTFNQLTVGDFRKAFIFDGTAAIDSAYPQNMLVIDFDDPRRFENTTVHVNKQHNLSKTYYDDHPQFIPEIVEEILAKLKIHDKILVVTYKEQEEIYRQYITAKLLEKRVYIDHFNNLKGKNEYRECTCVFILGSLYKGDEYYGLFVHEDLNNIEFVNLRKQRLAYYKDSGKPCKSINDFMITDSVKEIVQMFFRGSTRDDPKLTADLYFFSTNDYVINGITDFFNNANLTDDWLNNKSPEYQNFIDALYSEFEHTPPHRIAKSDFREKYGISKSTLPKFLKTDVVINTLDVLHINNKNKTLSNLDKYSSSTASIN